MTNKKQIAIILTVLLASVCMISLILNVAIMAVGLIGNQFFPEQDIHEYRIVTNLEDNKTLVVWREGGGATEANAVLASILDEYVDPQQYINQPYTRSNVFYAYMGENICFEVQSPTSIVIIHNGLKIYKDKKSYQGIDFEYVIGDCPEW